jgi:hypothetical protein
MNLVDLVDLVIAIMRTILVFNALLIICAIPWYWIVGRHREIRLSEEELAYFSSETHRAKTVGENPRNF